MGKKNMTESYIYLREDWRNLACVRIGMIFSEYCVSGKIIYLPKKASEEFFFPLDTVSYTFFIARTYKNLSAVSEKFFSWTFSQVSVECPGYQCHQSEGDLAYIIPHNDYSEK